jgi:hypothetical protein
MTDSVFDRQSSTLTIKTPTKDDVFDFSKSFKSASYTERANTPKLMIDQSIHLFLRLITKISKAMEQGKNIHQLRCRLTMAQERGDMMIQIL